MLIKVSDTHGIFKGPCAFSGQSYQTAEFPLEAYRRYSEGDVLIQNALSMLSVDDREFILSGISPLGWDLMAAEEDDYFYMEDEDFEEEDVF